LIVAGPHDQRKVFAVYRWSGKPEDPPVMLHADTAAVNQVGTFTPEALIVYPGDGKVQLLSDDGALKVAVNSPSECKPGTFKKGYCEAKHLLDRRRQTFRSMWLSLK
jgi:hypothetical protein